MTGHDVVELDPPARILPYQAAMTVLVTGVFAVVGSDEVLGGADAGGHRYIPDERPVEADIRRATRTAAPGMDESGLGKAQGQHVAIDPVGRQFDAIVVSPVGIVAVAVIEQAGLHLPV